MDPHQDHGSEMQQDPAPGSWDRPLTPAKGPSALSKGSPKGGSQQQAPWGVKMGFEGPSPRQRQQLVGRDTSARPWGPPTWTNTCWRARAGSCHTRAALRTRQMSVCMCVRMTPAHLQDGEGSKTGSGPVVQGARLQDFRAWGWRATHLLDSPMRSPGRTVPFLRDDK